MIRNKNKIIVFVIVIILFLFLFSDEEKNNSQQINDGSENYYNNLFCAKLNGKREQKHFYRYKNKKGYIFVDCETDEYVYEGGKDKRSSLDSVQQAIFFSTVTDKKPAIVIYNTDNKYGKFEHRIKTVAKKLEVKFVLVDVTNF